MTLKGNLKNKNIFFLSCKRQINFIIMDPTGKLAVMNDTFGRILLIDIINNIILRIWKGYRDAQCVWLQYPNNNSSMIE